MTCGIYKIVNLLDGKTYVGSSAKVEHRLRHHHLHRLRRNTHWNPHLQAAWNRDGEASFRLELVEETSPEHLLDREQHWMDFFRSFEREKGYNISPTANRSEWSEESKAKASLNRKGKSPVPAGWRHTNETRIQISRALKGRKKPRFSKEHRDKLGSRVRNRTYEELYGSEKAAIIKAAIREKMKEYHERRKANAGR